MRVVNRKASAIAAILFLSTSTSVYARDVITMGASIAPEMLLPIFVANNKGCFANKNIELKMRMLGGPATRDALMAGEINFAAYHVAPVWIAVTKGLPFKFVSMYYSKEIFGAIAIQKLRDKVKSLQDLKSLNGLTSTPGSASYEATVFLLKRSGLDVNRDVQMTYLASTDPKIWLNSLESEKVSFEAGVWEPTFTAAVRKGIAFPIFDPADPVEHTRMYGGDVSTLCLVTTTEMIKSNPDLVKRATDCVEAGLSEIPQAGDQELVEAMESGGISLDRSDLAAVIRRIRGNFESTGRPSKSKYERAMSAYLQAGFLQKSIAFEDVVDTRFTGAAP